MKYLKTYKIFETIGYSELTDDMWNNISDILLELEDDGFVVSQDISDVEQVSNKLCQDVVEIVVNKTSMSDFSYSEIEDVFRRLIDYLGPYGWNYSILYFGAYVDAGTKHNFIEFECGGEHPLSKVVDGNIDFKDMTHRSQLDVLQECQAFKIVFYQDIDRLVNIHP
jgi:hypothetical protein